MPRVMRFRSENPGATSRLAARFQGRSTAAPAPAARAPSLRVRRTPVAAAIRQVEDFPEDAAPLSDLLKSAQYTSRPARGTEYLHVSDLINRCIRRIAIIEQHNITPPAQRLSLTDILTFGQGDAIHDIVKERASVGGPMTVWGNWSCRCGKLKTESPCVAADLPRDTCDSCDESMTKYHEVPMRNEAYKIVGNPDLILRLPDYEAFYITELKSIAHDQWKELVRAKPDHVIQILFYYWLMKELGYKLIPKVSVLYVTKGWIFSGAPYKEFVIDAEEELERGRLDPYLELADALAVYRKTGKLPARTQCVSDQAPDAKKCDVCSLCFSNTTHAPKKVSIRQALGRR